MTQTTDRGLLVQSVSALACAYFAKNTVPLSEVPTVIEEIARSLGAAPTTSVTTNTPQEPAVAIKSSIKPDYLVCLEDGQRLKSLKRYLRGKFNLTPEQYRAKWGLPADYPMVAPNYSAVRSRLAKEAGLGRKAKTVDEFIQSAPEPVVEELVAEAIADTAPDTVAMLDQTENPEIVAFDEGLRAGLNDDDGSVEAADPGEVTPALADEGIPASVLAFQDDDDASHQPQNSVNPESGPGKLPEGYATASDTFVVKDGERLIVCLIDSKSVRDLGRHARKHHGVNAEQYRAMFGLPANYPMTANGIDNFSGVAPALPQE